MILSFRDPETERFYRERGGHPRWQAAAKTAARKLDMLNAAKTSADLRAPPGNRLEALSGDRVGQFSIRIHDQWRICFRWPDGALGPSEVEIVGYHR